MTNEIVEKIISIASSPIEEARIHHLFALSRKLIERVPNKTQYALLRFYCDWTVHSEIDRSKEGELLLSRIHNIILKHLKISDNSSLVSELTEALSFETLREQINALVLYSGGPNDLFERAKWNKIIIVLAEIVSHCPLKIGKYFSTLDTLKKSPLKGDSVVSELSIVKIPKSTISTDSTEVLIYCLVITTTDKIHFVVPIS